MIPKRVFLISEEAAVQIIRSHFWNKDRELENWLKRNSVENDGQPYEELIKKVSDKDIEFFLNETILP